ncbi:oxygen-independent coproporphyrinogen-3 oxidase [Marinoscillum furvescens DSM 4134]|uniref:Heme chaperone HemW n=1 Tax=Marinoscillum furvescens DSM 4134 TaxID=1122208 RepID=A0A3D9L4P3_MARFU|nr:oxygen-independent coproporphyrinogen-3 oxidase [Marinoscillum furvescens DSM 4134]
MAGIYLHIPFCKQACHYCNFHFSTQLNYKSEMIAALCQEVEIRHGEISEPITSIYFGGGTPSLLAANELEAIFSALRSYFEIAPKAEITLEANPDDLDQEKLSMLKESGINRLSIGIQSFDDDSLKYCNRAHDSSEAASCLKLAKDAGFTNISADLMYALPGTDLDHWAKDLQRLLLFSPRHISLYGLTIEERTVFGKWQTLGKLDEVPEVKAADQYRLAIEVLSNAGYDHYEVSNFAKPGYHSRHNTSYWQGAPYLGIGPGAHSYNGKARGANISNNQTYMRAIRSDQLPIEWEQLSDLDKLNEYLFTGLRTNKGIDLNIIKEQFGKHLYDDYKALLSDFATRGLLTKTNNNIRLTSEGFMIADEITWRLFYDT